MTTEEMDRLGITPSAYRFEADPYLRVERRGGAWAVVDSGDCLNRDGEMEYEPQPSSRDQEFLARCRFPLDEALRRAVDYLGRRAAEESHIV